MLYEQKPSQGTIKTLKNGTSIIIPLTVLKMEHSHFYNAVIGLKDADGMTNSVDPDQTAPFRSSLI